MHYSKLEENKNWFIEKQINLTGQRSEYKFCQPHKKYTDIRGTIFFFFEKLSTLCNNILCKKKRLFSLLFYYFIIMT